MDIRNGTMIWLPLIRKKGQMNGRERKEYRMKKWMTVCLAAVTAAVFMAGCGSTSDAKETAKETAAASSEVETTKAETAAESEKETAAEEPRQMKRVQQVIRRVWICRLQPESTI